MNKIGFKVEHREYGGKEIIPIIDDKSLISILKDFEFVFAKSEGSPKIAGQYGGIYLSNSISPTKYFLGENLLAENKNKTLILLCDCACEGCWDFLARIKVQKSVVTWNEFEQIHRENWDYQKLKTFTFEREQYEKALCDLESEIKFK